MQTSAIFPSITSHCLFSFKSPFYSSHYSFSSHWCFSVLSSLIFLPCFSYSFVIVFFLHSSIHYLPPSSFTFIKLFSFIHFFLFFLFVSSLQFLIFFIYLSSFLYIFLPVLIFTAAFVSPFFLLCFISYTFISTSLLPVSLHHFYFSATNFSLFVKM